MAISHELGRRGERLAANYLQANGYEILDRNWHAGHVELDIVARRGETVIFVEVKTRGTDRFGPPEGFVTKRKQRLLSAAAAAYMQANGYEWALRFDVVSIVWPDGEAPVVEHYEDAFFPGIF